MPVIGLGRREDGNRPAWFYGFFTGFGFGWAAGLVTTLIWLSIAGQSMLRP